VPHQINEVSRIRAIMDGERAIQADLIGIFAQKPGTDRMKCPGPGEGICHELPLLRQHLHRDALDTAAHLGRGSP
jgi:hypothetical protein